MVVVAKFKSKFKFDLTDNRYIRSDIYKKNLYSTRKSNYVTVMDTLHYLIAFYIQILLNPNLIANLKKRKIN